MSGQILTPPMVSMTIALREEIRGWWPRVAHFENEARTHHEKQQQEIFESLLVEAINEEQRAHIRSTFVPKPFVLPNEEQLNISIATSVEILRQMFRTCISARSCFEETDYGSLETLLTQSLGWFVGMNSDVDYYSARFYGEIIDPVLIEIQDLISPVIPEQTWDVWSVYNTERGHFYLKNDGDFRVNEWRSLVESGVIDCPTKKKNKQQAERLIAASFSSGPTSTRQSFR